MKKTLNIDGQLFKEAKVASGATTDTDTVRLGLESAGEECGLSERPRTMCPDAVRSRRLNAGWLDGRGRCGAEGGHSNLAGVIEHVDDVVIESHDGSFAIRGQN
jgi:hypothetical protein